ncbi:hypothetical protein CEXT_434071, partial [Caerostris extrusa]
NYYIILFCFLNILKLIGTETTSL